MFDFLVDNLEQIKLWIFANGLRILLILALWFATLKLAKSLSKRLFERMGRKEDDEYKKRMDTLASLVSITLAITISAVGLVLVLGELGIEIGPILAAAGVVGVAVGFGAQHLVQDVISGFFIFMEDQIRVGDVVQIAGKGGLVERVNLRMTILRDLAGNVHYVRNGQIDVVTNMTKDYSRYVFEIGVAYRENVDEVIRVVQEVDEELRGDETFGPDILEPIEILGLDKFGDNAVVIKARTMTKPIKQWSVGREFNRRLKARFDAEGIEIPFPHRTIYFGEDKDGTAPPLRLHRQAEQPQE
jgi:small conductance mechanosensitive channel